MMKIKARRFFWIIFVVIYYRYFGKVEMVTGYFGKLKMVTGLPKYRK